MRKLILIAALVLASATAQAGQSRSLTVAANDQPSAAAPAKAAVTPKVAETPNAAETPTYVDQPALVEPKAEQPAAGPAKPVAEKTAAAPKADKPRRKRYWNEARIINELHRQGIYW
jgi:hypothetical protein